MTEQKAKNPEGKKPEEKKAKEEIEQVTAIKKYCEHVLDKFKPVIKSVWLLTSSEFSKTKDMTAVIIFDDIEIIDHLTRKKLDVCAHEAAHKVKKEHGISIHTSYYNLSEYWDLIRHGSPVTFQEIRDGIPVYDPSGFFVPLKKLLSQGRIPGTKESMRALIGKAPLRIKRIRHEFMLNVLEKIYTAVVDSGQAPLIMAGFSPPAQKMVASTLKDVFVKKKMLEPEYVRYADEIVRTWKDYEHGKIKTISGAMLDKMLENAGRFIRRMEDLMEEIEAEKVKNN
ncbi:MAG: hypothetical protein KAS11_03880 [Candidatus Aenigmarchaeota archaeon]|nr:hypothetical protein [Candidatus Aenigmarchaeota archaeon]